jgi:hypothetical protein
MEQEYNTKDLKAEIVSKKELECERREFACELLLQHEERRFHELMLRVRQVIEHDRAEFLRHRCELERKNQDLRNCLEYAIFQKELATNELRGFVQQCSDEKVFEALQRLKLFFQNEYFKTEFNDKSDVDEFCKFRRKDTDCFPEIKEAIQDYKFDSEVINVWLDTATQNGDRYFVRFDLMHIY